jgi:hypothetical protein
MDHYKAGPCVSVRIRMSVRQAIPQSEIRGSFRGDLRFRKPKEWKAFLAPTALHALIALRMVEDRRAPVWSPLHRSEEPDRLKTECDRAIVTYLVRCVAEERV